MVYWRKLKDGSFAVINDFIDLKDEENQTIMLRNVHMIQMLCMG